MPHSPALMGFGLAIVVMLHPRSSVIIVVMMSRVVDQPGAIRVQFHVTLANPKKNLTA